MVSEGRYVVRARKGGLFLESFQQCVCAFASKFGLTCAFQCMFWMCLRLLKPCQMLQYRGLRCHCQNVGH